VRSSTSHSRLGNWLSRATLARAAYFTPFEDSSPPYLSLPWLEHNPLLQTRRPVSLDTECAEIVSVEWYWNQQITPGYSSHNCVLHILLQKREYLVANARFIAGVSHIVKFFRSSKPNIQGSTCFPRPTICLPQFPVIKSTHSHNAHCQYR
jgi:hypothetical protein